VLSNHPLNNSEFESIFSQCQGIRMLWNQLVKGYSDEPEVGAIQDVKDRGISALPFLHIFVLGVIAK
jgi:hypothetical protein